MNNIDVLLKKYYKGGNIMNAKEYMKTKDKHTLPMSSHTKGELVDDKDDRDLVISQKEKYNNPYKTPPNNLTSKDHENI